MPSAGEDVNDTVPLIIDDSVLFIHSPTPKPMEITLERLRFSDSIKDVSFHIFQDGVDSFQRLFILRLPIHIVAPCSIFKQ